MNLKSQFKCIKIFKKDNHALFTTFFQICTISHHLLNSAIIHDCSDDLTNLQDLDDSKKRKILDRCGQFEDECGDGSNICKTHLEALDSKFKQMQIVWQKIMTKKNPEGSEERT